MRADGFTVAEIAAAIGITPRSARDAVSRMIDTGEVPPRCVAWTPTQEQTLSQMTGLGCSDQEIATATGRTVQAVHRKRARLGRTKQRLWTSDEEASLTELVSAKKSDEEIAGALGRPVWGIIARRRRLGLRS